jgi:shikimate dehydrogenase
MTAISGSTRVFYILGDPVVQVKAPTVYNHLFQQHGIDAVLVPLQAPRRRCPASCSTAWRPRTSAASGPPSRTSRCWPTCCKPKDPVAAVAGAVNAVRRLPDGTLEAALFDGIGFVKGLDQFGIPVTGRKVLVVGAGGGGHAVAAALAQRKPAALAIYNRTAERAAALVQRLQGWPGRLPRSRRATTRRATTSSSTARRRA